MNLRSNSIKKDDNSKEIKNSIYDKIIRNNIPNPQYPKINKLIKFFFIRNLIFIFYI